MRIRRPLPDAGRAAVFFGNVLKEIKKRGQEGTQREKEPLCQCLCFLTLLSQVLLRLQLGLTAFFTAFFRSTGTVLFLAAFGHFTGLFSRLNAKSCSKNAETQEKQQTAKHGEQK